MPTSGTTTFDLNTRELIEEAYERVGIEVRGGYQLQTARRSLNMLLLEWANRGLNLWTVESVVLPLVATTAAYALAADTVDVVDAAVRLDGIDTALQRVSFDTYSKISNKTQTGRPSLYTVKRAAIPYVTLWQVPDSSAYSLYYWRMRRMYEASADTGNTMDVPFRFIPALAAGLAYYLAMKVPEATQRIPLLKAFYEEEFHRAEQEDRDRSSLFIRPAIG